MSSARLGVRPGAKFTKVKQGMGVRTHGATVATTSTSGLVEAHRRGPGKNRNAIERELRRRGVDLTEALSSEE